MDYKDFLRFFNPRIMLIENPRLCVVIDQPFQNKLLYCWIKNVNCFMILQYWQLQMQNDLFFRRFMRNDWLLSDPNANICWFTKSAKLEIFSCFIISTQLLRASKIDACLLSMRKYRRGQWCLWWLTQDSSCYFTHVLFWLWIHCLLNEVSPYDRSWISHNCVSKSTTIYDQIIERFVPESELSRGISADIVLLLRKSPDDH